MNKMDADAQAVIDFLDKQPGRMATRAQIEQGTGLPFVPNVIFHARHHYAGASEIIGGGRNTVTGEFVYFLPDAWGKAHPYIKRRKQRALNGLRYQERDLDTMIQEHGDDPIGRLQRLAVKTALEFLETSP